jgi:hypothetical protein
MDQMLALFPLNTVLFPGGTLPLHIFEERYKQMIGRCISLKEPFGVVLIREGVEVGGQAEPYDIGTTAKITNALRLDNGQMFIAAEGALRFRIREKLQTEPYIIAAIEMLDEPVGLDHRAQAEQLHQLYERYRRAVTFTAGANHDLPDLPDDPQAVSFQLSAQLQVPNFSKQQLLEAELETRLEALIEALADELRYLPEPSDTPPSSDRRWSLN